MKYFEFTQEEKAEAFDRLSKLFYERNFGQATKSEIELIMFSTYLDKMIEESQDENGLLDYSKCSDYKIGKELGLTNQRVRNLKVKKQLAYRIDFDWKQSFASLTKNARYDQETHRITIPIPDPNLYIEIQNFIEEAGGYIDKQLNPSVLIIRAEYYIQLLTMSEEEPTRKAIIKSMRKDILKSGKSDKLLDEKNIGKSLLDIGVNLTTLLANISTIATGPVWSALTMLVKPS